MWRYPVLLMTRFRTTIVMNETRTSRRLEWQRLWSWEGLVELALRRSGCWANVVIQLY